MAELIIYLHPSDLAQSMWRIDQTTHVGELDLLQEKAKDRYVRVLVPARDVLLLKAQLPQMSRTRLLQALPFAVEEELIADIEDLHFAIGTQSAEGTVYAAVVAKEKLAHWIAQLAEVDVKVNWMGSSVFALPFNVDAWQVAVMQDVAISRTQEELGFACDPLNLVPFLEKAIEESEIPPQKVSIINYSGEKLTVKLSVPVEESVKPENDLMTNVAMSGGVNLLQGQYAKKAPSRFSSASVWRATSLLAIVLVLLVFLKPIVSNLILGQKLSSINQQIAMIYKRHFPESTNIVTPRERLNEKWQQLTNAGSQNQVLLLLADIHQAMTKASNIKLKRFDYQNNSAVLELQAGSSEEFAKFTEELSALGLNIKQENANLVEGKISASIQISAS